MMVLSPAWVRKARQRTRADAEQIEELAIMEAELADLIPLQPPGRWRRQWSKRARVAYILQRAVLLKLRLTKRRRRPAATAKRRQSALKPGAVISLSALKPEEAALVLARRLQARYLPDLGPWTSPTVQRLLRQEQSKMALAERLEKEMARLYGPSWRKVVAERIEAKLYRPSRRNR
jgi:hypothetical protein